MLASRLENADEAAIGARSSIAYYLHDIELARGALFSRRGEEIFTEYIGLS